VCPTVPHFPSLPTRESGVLGTAENGVGVFSTTYNFFETYKIRLHAGEYNVILKRIAAQIINSAMISLQ